MKTSFRSLIILFAGCFLFSCNGDSSKSSSTTDSSTVKAAPTDTSVNKMNSNNSGDQDIVNTLVTANTKEIAWINAAISKSSNKEIKSHASMMLKDHQKLGSDVSDLIAKKNFSTPPLPDTTNEVNINDKSGKDWDKAWVDKMVDDHAGLLEKLNGFESSAQDADLKAAVTKAKPVVQSHLDMAKGLQGKMK